MWGKQIKRAKEKEQKDAPFWRKTATLQLLQEL